MRRRWIRITLGVLVLGERLAQLLNRGLLLFRRQHDLARQHHRHRSGRVLQELVDPRDLGERIVGPGELEVRQVPK